MLLLRRVSFAGQGASRAHRLRSQSGPQWEVLAKSPPAIGRGGPAWCGLMFSCLVRVLAAAPALGYAAENEPARGFGVFRWKNRKKGHGFLSYHRRIPVRHCLTYLCSGLRELAMPAQNPGSHGAISPPFLIASIGRFHPCCWLIVVRIIAGHCHRYM